MNSRFSVNVHELIYDSIELGPQEGRPWLNLIIERTQEYERLYKVAFTVKPDVKKSILSQISQIVEASCLPAEFNIDNVHLITDDFSREAMWQAAGS